MEVKKNLNNQQRKMLDEIYTQQFEMKKRIILENRANGFNELKAKVLEELTNSRKFKALITAGEKFHALLQESAEELRANGLEVANGLYRNSEAPSLKYAYSNSTENPKLAAYVKRTQEIEVELGEKRQLMRSAIYGMATDFASVKAEVEALLADIKI